jgi:hypothetical protein
MMKGGRTTVALWVEDSTNEGREQKDENADNELGIKRQKGTTSLIRANAEPTAIW